MSPVLKKNKSQATSLKTSHSVSATAESQKLTITFKREEEPSYADQDGTDPAIYQQYAEQIKQSHSKQQSLFQIPPDKVAVKQKTLMIPVPGINSSVAPSESHRTIEREIEPLTSTKYKKKNLFDVGSLQHYKMQLPDLNLKTPQNDANSKQLQPI